MGGKWLGVLQERRPTLGRVAVLFGSDKPPIPRCRAAEMQAAARRLGSPWFPS